MLFVGAGLLATLTASAQTPGTTEVAQSFTSKQAAPASPGTAKSDEEYVFDFGSVDSKKVVVHTFTLRNDTQKPLTVRQIQTTCGCLTLPDPTNAEGRLPILTPGETYKVTVALDAAQIPERVALTRTGSTFSRQVWVYAKEEAVHPVFVLEMRGRITQGAAFEPPQLDFGMVRESQGSHRTLRVQIDAGLYQPEKTRLVSSDPEVKTILQTKRTIEKDSKIEFVYDVIVPPHALIGALSGTLAMEGLASRVSVGVPASNSNEANPITNRTAFSGQVQGQIVAEPGMAVFGVVRSVVGVTTAAAQENARQRTRWLLLIGPSPILSPAAKGKTARRSARSSSPVPFWHQAKVQNDTSLFHADIVAPVKQTVHTLSPVSTADSPPPIPETLKPGSACWLRVRLSMSAPSKKPLSGNILLAFADGERLRVPIMAQHE